MLTVTSGINHSRCGLARGVDEMIVYTCTRCSGMGDGEITFEVWEDGDPYTYGGLSCPICGMDRAVQQKEV